MAVPAMPHGRDARATSLVNRKLSLTIPLTAARRLHRHAWIARVIAIEEQMFDQRVEIDRIGNAIVIEIATGRWAAGILHVGGIEEDDVDQSVHIDCRGKTVLVEIRLPRTQSVHRLIAIVVDSIAHFGRFGIDVGIGIVAVASGAGGVGVGLIGIAQVRTVVVSAWNPPLRCTACSGCCKRSQQSGAASVVRDEQLCSFVAGVWWNLTPSC